MRPVMKAARQGFAFFIGGLIVMTQPQTEVAAQTTRGVRSAQEQAADTAGEIRPFHVHFSDADLADMKRRVLEMRWPSREVVADRSQGVQLATLQKLADYWANSYDWRR